MSVNRQLWMAAVLLLGAPVAADEPPDMALLEYLGSWEESDEDWVLLTEEMHDQSTNTDDTGSEPAAQAEDSQETEHES